MEAAASQQRRSIVYVGVRRKQLESPRGFSDTELLCKCLLPWVGVDICPADVTQHLCTLFLGLKNFSQVLPPPSRSQNLLFPASFADGEMTWDHGLRGDRGWTGPGGVFNNRRDGLGWWREASPQLWLRLTTRGNTGPGPARLSRFPQKTPDPDFNVKSSCEEWVLIQKHSEKKRKKKTSTVPAGCWQYQGEHYVKYMIVSPLSCILETDTK